MQLETCPKCETELNILPSSGRQICPSCKWMNQLEANETNETNETNEKNNTTKNEVFNNDLQNKFMLLSNQAKANNQKLVKNFFEDKSIDITGRIFFLSGLVIMLFGGIFYDTTNCEGSSYYKSCTHNIGLLNTRSNIVNIGGFLCVSGCVLFGKSRRD